jgi:deoxyuridine 5'-triphosphate nucleotidohydrolase
MVYTTMAAFADVLDVQVLSSQAMLPVRMSATSAGFDLTAAESVVVSKGGRALVSTGLAMRAPPGTYIRIAPRSGLAVKKGIHVGAGVVDEDYRGEVKVLLFNLGEEDFGVEPGDRIAQAIVEVILQPRLRVVEVLDDSARGCNGFGSTGV